MSESFGDCEAANFSKQLQAAGISQLAAPAAPQGITYVVGVRFWFCRRCDNPIRESRNSTLLGQCLGAHSYTVAVGEQCSRERA